MADVRPEDFGAVPIKRKEPKPEDFGAVAVDPARKVEQFQAERPTEDNSMLKQLGESAIEYAPEIGSLVGGIAGSMFPGAGTAAGAAVGGRLIGGLAGTALGTSIGTSTKQIDRTLRGESQTTAGILGEQFRNVAEQTAYQLIGEGIWKAGSKAVSWAMAPAREGAAVAQKQLTQKGGSLSAAQAVESPTLNLVESYARAGAGGKGRFITLEGQNAQALEAIKEELIKKVSANPANDRVAGKMFQDAIARGDAAHSAAATALYDSFDQRVAQAIQQSRPWEHGGDGFRIPSPNIVDATAVSGYGRNVAAELVRIGNVGKTETGGRLIDQLANVPERLTFSEAQRLRSNLLALIRDMKSSSSPETKAIRTASGALQQVERAMEDAASKLPGDLYGQYRQANAFYKKGKDAFNNDLMIDLVSRNPERVGEVLFHHGNVSEIIQAKASLRYAKNLDPRIDAPEVYNRLQAGFLNAKLNSKAATNIEGETTAKNLLKELAEAKTDRQFQVMFNEGQREEISRFARTAYLTLQNKPQNFGVLAPLLQAAAIGDLVSGAAGGPSTRNPLVDIGLIASPHVLAKLLTNPKAVSVLTRAISLPPNVATSGPVFAKLVGDLVSAWTGKSPQEPPPAPTVTVPSYPSGGPIPVEGFPTTRPAIIGTNPMRSTDAEIESSLQRHRTNAGFLGSRG